MANFVYKQRLGVPGDFVYERLAPHRLAPWNESLVPLGRVVEKRLPDGFVVKGPRWGWFTFRLDGEEHDPWPYVTRHEAAEALRRYYTPPVRLRTDAPVQEEEAI